MVLYLLYHVTLVYPTLLSTEAPVTPAKRKAEGKKDTPPAKKAKSEGEGKRNCTEPSIEFELVVMINKGLNTDV